MNNFDYNANGNLARDMSRGWQNPARPAFTTPDPMAEDYLPISPYAYCGGDPINRIDPTGMVIEPGSIEEWEKMKEAIINELTHVSNTIELKRKTLQQQNISESQQALILESLFERLFGLRAVLKNIKALESSDQTYALDPTNSNDIGGMTLNGNTIVFSYNGIAQFVHEITHGVQFENGEIAFSKDREGNWQTVLTDFHDEMIAYKLQYSYDPNSVPGQPSSMNKISFKTL